jgi:hypothetical protein
MPWDAFAALTDPDVQAIVALSPQHQAGEQQGARSVRSLGETDFFCHADRSGRQLQADTIA